MSACIDQVAPASSIGLRVYAEELVAALERRGIAARRVERRISRDARSHFHLANSTRSLWPSAITAPAPSVITVHDVLPRARALRFTLGPLQWRPLSNHVAIVHSNHSADLLRHAGFSGRIDVIPMGTATGHPPPAARAAERERLGAGADRSLFVLAGILKGSKGLDDVVAAAAAHPASVFVVMGRAYDDGARQTLASAPANVVHVGDADDERFRSVLSAADVYLSFRTDSVGEVSHTAVLAHGAGTPIAGYDLGFLGEYSCEHDILFEPGVPVPEALARLHAEDLRARRIPRDHPVVTSWDTVAQHHAGLYARIGWA